MKSSQPSKILKNKVKVQIDDVLDDPFGKFSFCCIQILIFGSNWL